jgi:hypothetical protein
MTRIKEAGASSTHSKRFAQFGGQKTSWPYRLNCNGDAAGIS